MLKEITLNGQKISYDLQRKRVKNLNLRIKADGTVTLSAAPHIPQRVIDEFLLTNADRILAALTKCEEAARNTPKPLQYVSGERIRVLGEDNPLLVVKGSRNAVTFDGVTVTLTVKDTTDTTCKQRLINQWLRALCRDTVTSLCQRIYPLFSEYGFAFPEIRFRSMVSRWGSCQPTHKILTFNTALIALPLPCIEYVVMHEFTHFLHPDHSARFYESLSHRMPDWKVRKELLRRMEPSARLRK